MCIEIAQSVVAALGRSNLGLDAKRSHFAPVQHLVVPGDEDQGVVPGCCDPTAAKSLKLVNEARFEKKCLCCVVPLGLRDKVPGQVPRRMSRRVDKHHQAVQTTRQDHRVKPTQ